MSISRQMLWTIFFLIWGNNIKVSAVIITFNEEKRIETTLQSISWCDEILIIDSGSNDKTLDICKKYGCKILFRKFDGYGPQKKFAVANAANDWILAIDADEIITDSLKNEIEFHLSGEKQNSAGYYIPISLFFQGKKLRFGGSFIKKKLRLFNRKSGNFNDNKVHESVELVGSIRQLKNEILHCSYPAIYDYFNKFNNYTETAAVELFYAKKNCSKSSVFLRFPIEFIKRYFFQLAILDGYPGFLWSLFCAMYPVVKYAKLVELNRK